MSTGSILLLAIVAAELLSLRATPAQAQTVAEIDAIVRLGIRQGIYPGAVVVIGRRDSVLYARGYGHFTWSPASPVPSPDSTLWDIASITKVMGMIPGFSKLQMQGMVDDQEVEGRMSKVEAIINSMTPKERENPDIINVSRKNRIAKGSGTTLQELNKLMKQFQDTKKMMRMMSDKRNMMNMMKQFKNMGGKMPME